MTFGIVGRLVGLTPLKRMFQKSPISKKRLGSLEKKWRTRRKVRRLPTIFILGVNAMVPSPIKMVSRWTVVGAPLGVRRTFVK